MAGKRNGEYWRRFSLAIVLLAVLMLSCGPMQFFVAPTPTPTQTFTPTSTFTPSPTSTPTETPTPTATPIQFTFTNQADGSTLVENQVLGYQFVLPKVWKIESFGSMYISAYFYSDVFDKVTLALYMQDTKGTLEDELLKRKSQDIQNYDKVIASVLTTNGYGTNLGYLRYKNFAWGSIHGYIYGETYEILFMVEDIVVTISINKVPPLYVDSLEFSTTDLQAIHTIQNSIRIK